MPEGRKRGGVPNSLIIDAKTKFGLKSKSAILRAYKRGKKLKEMLKEFFEEYCGRKLSWEELEELKSQWNRDGVTI